MKSRRKRLKIRRTTARNNRSAVFKYIPIDENKSVAVQGGRCYRCRRITTGFCLSCGRFVCGKHSSRDSDEVRCTDCKEGSKGISYTG